jgi:hypothetical protein
MVGGRWLVVGGWRYIRVQENQKAKGKRQKAKIKRSQATHKYGGPPLRWGYRLIFAFCLLPFAF